MNRRHGWYLLAFLIAGCSTHPITDFCDLVQPGKMGPTKVQQPYGGVAIPQGPITPPAPGAPVIGVPGATLPGPAFPGGAVIPGPAPLPGNAPTQLQPPIPPPPPPRNF